MRLVAREVGFAVLAWLLPLVASISMFSLRESHRPLFESLIAVALPPRPCCSGASIWADRQAATYHRAFVPACFG